MQLLHESVVTADEIDSLGHMNVRFYMARMEAANRKLLTQLGLPTDAGSDQLLRRTDTYTRFRREQFEGARLHAVGGVLSVREGGMQSYVEIRNPDSNEVALAFTNGASRRFDADETFRSIVSKLRLLKK